MAKVFWTMLKERHGIPYQESLDSLLDITEYNARKKDFHRLKIRPLPVAHARNAACQAFWETTEINGKPFTPAQDDTLVMLDCDHVMQRDIVEKLAAHDKGVVGALATSRGEVPFLCMFGKGTDGGLYNLSEWQDGELVEGVIVGSGAIAIKRWVLYRLQHMSPSWFRYTYGGHRFESTEEMIFGFECAKVGISHYCDTTIQIPHIIDAYVTPEEWRQWYKDHPEVRTQLVVPKEYEDLVQPAPVKEKANGNSGGNGWEQKTNIAAAITKRI
jgi:hypothetical protein